MGMIPYYSPHGDTIAALIARQGDIQAQAANRSGDIWSHAINQLGQIGAGAYQQYKDQKDEDQKTAALNTALSSFDPTNPMDFYRKMAPIMGAKPAMDATSSMVQLQGTIAKNAKGEVPSLDEANAHLKAVHSYIQADPNFLKDPAHYSMVRQTLAPALQAHYGFQMPEQYDPNAQLEKHAESLYETLNPEKKPEGALIDTVDAKGNPVKRRATEAELAQGVPMYQKPDKPESRSLDAQLADAARSGDKELYQRLLQVKRDEARAGHIDSEGGKPIMVSTTNDQGQPITTFISPQRAKEIAAGTAEAIIKAPGAQEQSRMASARNSIESGEKILGELKTPEFKAQIGAVMGRYNSLMAAYGKGDPTAQYLVGAIKSFAALQGPVHGYRAIKFSEDIEKLLNTKQSPDALAAGLEGILTASYTVAKQKPGTIALAKGESDLSKKYGGQ